MGFCVLSRRPTEGIVLRVPPSSVAQEIVVNVNYTTMRRTGLAVLAPPDVVILRSEVAEREAEGGAA